MANQINISRPTTWIVIISVILAILALIGHFARVQFLTEYQFWLAMIAYVALLLGVLVKDL
jgi:purine-cytosine permease-like protein